MSLDDGSSDDAEAPEAAEAQETTAEWLVGAKPSPESSTQLDPGRSTLPNEALLTELEEAVGGFGGYFFDGQTIHVYLLDPTVDKHNALIAANRVVDAHPELRTLLVRVVPPAFTLALYPLWYRAASNIALAMEGATSAWDGPSYMEFGVEYESDVAEVEARLDELGIPSRWFRVVVTGPSGDDTGDD